ncbi:MAG TPA: hypothetical protein VIF44_07520 [Candidatus Limnocylindrales bacterium]
MSRIVDRGAIFAGWVGLGMAVVVAMGFELIIAVQSLVFLFAPIGGLLIGFYANARSERRRPWRRVIANALYAGLFTAVSLAILYAGLRLVFVYGDAGYRDGTQGGPLTCTTGPQCTYARYLESGRGPELTAAGVTDAQTFERFVLQEQLNGALTIIGLVAGGALVGGLLYGAGTSRKATTEAGTATQIAG